MTFLIKLNDTKERTTDKEPHLMGADNYGTRAEL